MTLVVLRSRNHSIVRPVSADWWDGLISASVGRRAVRRALFCFLCVALRDGDGKIPKERYVACRTDLSHSVSCRLALLVRR